MPRSQTAALKAKEPQGSAECRAAAGALLGCNESWDCLGQREEATGWGLSRTEGGFGSVTVTARTLLLLHGVGCATQTHTHTLSLVHTSVSWVPLWAVVV